MVSLFKKRLPEKCDPHFQLKSKFGIIDKNDYRVCFQESQTQFTKLAVSPVQELLSPHIQYIILMGK